MTNKPLGPEVDGLRVLAVLLLVAGAARLGVPAGFVGLDIMFVVLGWSVTAGVARRAGEGLRLRDNVANWARSVLPLTAFGVVATLVASAMLLGADDLLRIARDGRVAAVLGLNWLVASDHIDVFAPGSDPKPLLHYWALATGAQMVVAWTCVLAIGLRNGANSRTLRRTAAFTLLVSVVSFAWSVFETGSSPFAFVSPLTRAWEMGVGVFLALATHNVTGISPRARGIGRWAGIAVLALAAVSFDKHSSFPGYAALVPVVGTAAVLASGLPARDRARIGA